MKKFLAIILTVTSLMCLVGCKGEQVQSNYQILFFYPRNSLAYGQEDAVISSEIRDMQNRTDDIVYIIRLYLNGPVSNELFSPFTSDTSLISLEVTDQQMYITLGGKAMSQKSQLQNTIAYACLAKTCFALTDVSEIHINSEVREASGSPAMVFDKNAIMLWDDAYVTAEVLPSDTN